MTWCFTSFYFMGCQKRKQRKKKTGLSPRGKCDIYTHNAKLAQIKTNRQNEFTTFGSKMAISTPAQQHESILFITGLRVIYY